MLPLSDTLGPALATASKPPSIGAPVTLPRGSQQQLILDPSPAVSGQAVLVLDQAEAQP